MLSSFFIFCDAADFRKYSKNDASWILNATHLDSSACFELYLKQLKQEAHEYANGSHVCEFLGALHMIVLVW